MEFRIWNDGEIPTADDLNSEWRDPLRFFLGDTRPFIVVRHPGAPRIPNGVWTSQTFPIEDVKRGGMVHSTTINTSRITVPMSGWYQGIMQPVFSAPQATNSGVRQARILINSSVVRCINYYDPPNVNDHFTSGGGTPIYLWLNANDYIEMQLNQTQGTDLPGSTAIDPYLALWWDAPGAEE